MFWRKRERLSVYSLSFWYLANINPVMVRIDIKITKLVSIDDSWLALFGTSLPPTLGDGV